MKQARRRITDQIVHTGQHYDDSMSKVFFEELEIPLPTVNLGIGSASQGAQTARMLETIERFLDGARPDVVIVYGDTNSTLAGALAAAKMQIPVAHVEAGLRSFNRHMPEELNRVVTDHLSQLLCAPTQTAIENLVREGLESRARFTGDVMYDAVLFNVQRARSRSRIHQSLRLEGGDYALATLHRAENTSARELLTLLQALNEAAARYGQIVFPMHPRTAAVLRRDGERWRPAANLLVIDPVGYFDMLALIERANCVLTDSGGLQKEAYFLGCPCITLRNETEWPETLTDDANVIAGNDGARVVELLEVQRRRRIRDEKSVTTGGPFGDGEAARHVVESVCELCGP